MPRPARILSFSATKAAPPPEAIAMESVIIVVTRCACHRRSSAASTPNKGLKKKVLNSLPKSRYDSAAHSELGDCAICLAEFAAGDEIRVLPQCRHSFHVACIDTWLAAHSSCPSCRQILVVATCRKCGDDKNSSDSTSLP